MRNTRTVVTLLIAFSLVISLVPTSLDYLDHALRLTIDLTEGTRIRQVQLLGLFAIAAWLCHTHRDAFIATVRHINPFLPLLALYCLASVLWSPLPVVTLKRVFILLGLIIVGLSIAATAPSSQQLTRALLGVLTAILALSLGAVIVAPHIGIDHALDGAWRGITWHKNLLGNAASYATLLWLYEWTRKELPRSACAAGFLFSLLMLLMSKSSTSTLLVMLACAVYLFWHRRWLYDYHINPIILLTCAIAAILFIHFHYVLAGQFPSWTKLTEPIALLFGKGPDLTGRTDIWQLLWLSIQQHPILGIGYGAFWLGAGSPAQFIADELAWMPAHGHNGYMDVLNELGAVGLALFIAVLVWHLVCIVRLMPVDRPMAALYLAILTIMLTHNVTESTFLGDTQLQNVIFVYLSTTLSAQMARLRRQPPAAAPYAPRMRPGDAPPAQQPRAQP